MDHSYDLGLEVRSDPNPPVSRSMRAVKQECNITGTERDEKALKPRKRALVACNRCRKRKIKCNGDLNNGLACSSCLTVGANECHYSRVNSLSFEAAKCFVAKTARSNPLSMGSTQMRAPYQREDYMEQPNFPRQNVGIDPLINYEDQSLNYQAGYMLASNVDYAWNRWDRPAGELFEENINQYNFVLPGQVSATLPSSIPEQPPTTFADIERTLPTPRSQERMSYNQRIKPDDAELVFGYNPMSTAEDTVPLPATVPSNYDSEMEFHTDRLARTYSRDAGQRVLGMDCTPDAYGYSSGRKTERTTTLMNGLQYTRVRHSDSVPYSLLPDTLPEYGREVHRSAISPLGHPAY